MAPPVPTVSVAAFAELTGLTTARIYQLIQEGMPHRMRGKSVHAAKLVPREAIRWMIDRAREEAKRAAPDPVEQEESKERIRKLRLDSAFREMEIAARRRELVPIDETEEFTRG